MNLKTLNQSMHFLATLSFCTFAFATEPNHSPTNSCKSLVPDKQNDATPDFPAEKIVEQTDVVSRLLYFYPNKIVPCQTVGEIAQVIRYARENNLKVSVRGGGFSQGGQWANNQGVILDLKGLNKIISVDPERQTLTVQTGATWEQVQEAIAPYGLAVQVMQSSNIFTVGGALSINAHGRDISFGSIINTVNWIKTLLPNGELLKASKTENTDLFRGAIGGLGQLGVIVEANLNLRPNKVYKSQVVQDIDYRKFEETFLDLVEKEEFKTGLAFARYAQYDPKHPDFLRKMFIVKVQEVPTNMIPADFNPTKKQEESFGYRFLAPLIFEAQRLSGPGKRLRTIIERRAGFKEELATLTQHMTPPVGFLLEKYNEEMRIKNRNIYWNLIHMPLRSLYRFTMNVPVDSTDILQEYFAPLKHFVAFTDALRKISVDEKINLLNVTIRYVPANQGANTPVINYAPAASFAFVLDISVGRKPEEIAKAKAWTQKLVTAVQELQGRPYLAYHPWMTTQQLEDIYPEIQELRDLKKKYDPQNMFINEFLKQYDFP